MSLKFELRRKSFHLSAIILPLLYTFISKHLISILLFIFTTIVVVLDISRHYNPKIKDLASKIFAKIMRSEEKGNQFKLTGASFMMLGFLITAVFFDKGLTITSWYILIISDSIAAIVGITIGKKLFNGKSISGTIAFYVSAFCISILCYIFIGYDSNFLIIIIACIIITIAEFYSKNIVDDNLMIPLLYCAATKSLYFLL